MEKKENNEEDKKEGLANIFSQISKDKKAPVAKDLVNLKHVETKKQEVSKDAIHLAKTLKDQVLEHDKFEKLSNDELTILEAFMGRRLFLSRIAIIVNQSRIPLGIPGLKKAELEDLLDGLSKKGYLESEIVGDQPVFFLTERGKYRIQ